MKTSSNAFWSNQLDQSVRTGTVWSPEGVEGGFKLRFVNNNQDVFDTVELFLQNFDVSVANIVTIAHAPDDVMVLYFSGSGEVASVKFSWDADLSRVTLNGILASSRIGVISRFENGSFEDGFSLASAVM